MAKEKTIKEAFRLLMVSEENQEGFFLAQIRVAWPQLFGQNVAKNTRGLQLRKKILFVAVNNSSVRNQLLMVREGIRQRLNEELGEDYLEEVIVK